MIIRGYKRHEYHANILDHFEENELGKLPGGKAAYHSNCPGGGRIEHNSTNKSISIYGYSVGFGLADHSITQAML